jgi:hypothetical protein
MSLVTMRCCDFCKMSVDATHEPVGWRTIGPLDVCLSCILRLNAQQLAERYAKLLVEENQRTTEALLAGKAVP